MWLIILLSLVAIYQLFKSFIGLYTKKDNLRRDERDLRKYVKEKSIPEEKFERFYAPYIEKRGVVEACLKFLEWRESKTDDIFSLDVVEKNKSNKFWFKAFFHILGQAVFVFGISAVLFSWVYAALKVSGWDVKLIDFFALENSLLWVANDAEGRLCALAMLIIFVFLLYSHFKSVEVGLEARLVGFYLGNFGYHKYKEPGGKSPSIDVVKEMKMYLENFCKYNKT